PLPNGRGSSRGDGAYGGGTLVWSGQSLANCATPSHSAGAMALRGIPVLDPLSATEVNDSSLEPGAPDFNAYPSPPQTGSARALRAMRERPAAPTRAASSLWLTRRWNEGEFEPSVPLLRKALLGIADREVRVSGSTLRYRGWVSHGRSVGGGT